MMRIGLTFAILILSCCSPCNGQDSRSPYEDRLVEALFKKKVQAELELVADQKKELKQLLGSLEQKREAFVRELTEFENNGATAAAIANKRKEIVAEFESVKQRTMSGATDVLLPHQQKRWRQAAVQIMMQESAKSNKMPSGLLTTEIRDYLEIDDQQAKRIKTKVTELQKELAEKIKELTEEAKSELLDELTRQQKAKYEELVGDPIKR